MIVEDRRGEPPGGLRGIHQLRLSPAYHRGMEISGRILREVEFRDRLRGYDTDEVDEFLEKIAVAVDELVAELDAAREKLARPTEPALDDESLRRTLVLAQRTADLAVREAREEATALVEDARLEAGALTAEARDEALRLRTEAEQDAHAKIAALEGRRDELEQEIEKLTRFAAAERGRLVAALTAALESLGGMAALEREKPTREARRPLPADETAEEMAAAAAGDDGGALGEEEDAAPPQMFSPRSEERPSRRSAATEKEAGGARDASGGDNRPARRGSRRPPDEPTLRAVGPIDDDDPDELLWQRWARGADLDAGPENQTEKMRSTPNDSGRRGGGWSA